MARGQVGLRSHPGELLAVDGALVEALAHGGLRRGHDDTRHVEVLGHDDLEEQGGGDHVDVGEPREVGEVVLVGGEVVHGVDTAQEVREQIPVADVTLVELDIRAQMASGGPWWTGGVERVEHHHLVPDGQEPLTGVGADEPRTSGDEDLHRLLRADGGRRPLGRHRAWRTPSPPT